MSTEIEKNLEDHKTAILANLSDNKRLLYYDYLHRYSKDTLTGFLLAFLGFSHFYTHKTFLGIIFIWTLGGCGIWYLIRLFTVFGDVRKFNYNLESELLKIIEAK